jgi:hypothetical protein
MNFEPPALQLVDLAGNAPLSAYLRATTEVCPFIEPSAKAGCLFSCVVTPDCQVPEDIHPRLFEQLVPLIERFRNARRAIAERQQRLLLCHTVLLDLPMHLDADAARLLNWPNWLGLCLKQLYTPKEIVLGFVRKNAVERSSFDAMMPPAPFHAIVIRSRVVGSDHRFFKGNEVWTQAIMEAQDDETNVHAANFPNAPDIRDPRVMRDANYFQRVQQWANEIINKQRSDL